MNSLPATNTNPRAPLCDEQRAQGSTGTGLASRNDAGSEQNRRNEVSHTSHDTGTASEVTEGQPGSRVKALASVYTFQHHDGHAIRATTNHNKRKMALPFSAGHSLYRPHRQQDSSKTTGKENEDINAAPTVDRAAAAAVQIGPTSSKDEVELTWDKKEEDSSARQQQEGKHVRKAGINGGIGSFWKTTLRPLSPRRRGPTQEGAVQPACDDDCSSPSVWKTTLRPLSPRRRGPTQEGAVQPASDDDCSSPSAKAEEQGVATLESPRPATTGESELEPIKTLESTQVDGAHEVELMVDKDDDATPGREGGLQEKTQVEGKPLKSVAALTDFFSSLVSKEADVQAAKDGIDKAAAATAKSVDTKCSDECPPSIEEPESDAPPDMSSEGTPPEIAAKATNPDVESPPSKTSPDSTYDSPTLGKSDGRARGDALPRDDDAIDYTAVNETFDTEFSLTPTKVPPSSTASKARKSKKPRQSLSDEGTGTRAKGIVRNNWKCLVLGFSLLAVVIISAFFYVRNLNAATADGSSQSTGNDNDNSPTADEREPEPEDPTFPTACGTAADGSYTRCREIYGVISGISGPDSLGTMNSPQMRAMDWIVFRDAQRLDPNDEVDVTESRLFQRYVLALLYFSLGGENWSEHASEAEGAVEQWASDESECSWAGVECSESGREIIGIDLGERNASGPIPPEIFGLKNLQKLDLYSNQVSGTLPPGIGNLPNLSFLDLTLNQIEGNIPDEIYDLTSLEYLYLSKNQMTGSLSSKIEQLSSLVDLRIDENEIEGILPSTVGTLTNLRYLIARSNKITGELPASIGNLENLYYLDLASNAMTGELPTDLADASGLRVLYLEHNEFNGEIPRQYGSLGGQELRSLSLNDNKLSGEVTREFEKLQALTSLYLQNNDFDRISRDLCGLSMFRRGALRAFEADCDLCECDDFCWLCSGE